jgi:hypothetical protein
MTKKCSSCKLIKDITFFNFKNKINCIYQSQCRDCNILARKKHYLKHSTSIKEKKSTRRDLKIVENRQNIWDYLKRHPCVDCNETDPIVLEFDHIGDKFMNISSMLKACYTWPSILKEITKCVVRCANCHRKKTAIQQNWYATVNK